MLLKELHERLIEVAQQRVQRGGITVRGLAKSSGISQPHMHNVLKNIRALSNGSADRLMEALQITVADLLWSTPGGAGVEVKAVPVLRSRLGPGSDAVLTVHRGTMPLPGHLLAGVVDPVAAVLAPDLVLPRLAAANDLALLDQNPAVRKNVQNAGIWIVAEAAGLRVRYVRMAGTELFVDNEATFADPPGGSPISLEERDILEIVRARIVWIGRELREEPSGA